jgi:hypothetical protein
VVINGHNKKDKNAIGSTTVDCLARLKVAKNSPEQEFSEGTSLRLLGAEFWGSTASAGNKPSEKTTALSLL